MRFAIFSTPFRVLKRPWRMKRTATGSSERRGAVDSQTSTSIPARESYEGIIVTDGCIRYLPIWF